MSSVFVTGSRGFVGSHLVPKLKEVGFEVGTDLELFNRHQERFDTVIHLAAVTNISCDFMPQLINSNIILSSEIFSKARHIIYASSCSAAHLTNPYAYSKRYCEYLGNIHGNAVGLRFHNIYGPNNNKGVVKFLMDKKDGERITVRGPELVRDYIHVDDVVKEIIRSFNYKPGVYDVGRGLGTETMALVNMYQELSGKRFDIRVEEAGANEPVSMVSNRMVPHMSLRYGLLKTINHGV